GSAILAGMEGTRPVLTEVQALVSPSPLGTPRRAVVGFDCNRLAMVLPVLGFVPTPRGRLRAVLEARAGLRIGAHDVYLNAGAGLKVREPAADLAAAASPVSSLHGAPLPGEAVLFGEIALSGAVRPVGQSEQRLKEAAKLGLTSAVIAGNGGEPGGARPLGAG